MTAKDNEKSQKQKFIASAREAECDERPEAFDRVLKKVAKAPPEKAKPDK